MKKYLFLLVFVLAINGISIFAQTGDGNLSSDKLWQEISDSALQQKSLQRSVAPQNYRTFVLNKIALKSLLAKSSPEFTNALRSEQIVMTLPMPDGTFARFSVEESPIMEPELAAKFPEIKTYRGQGIDDPTAIARFDLMPSGFHSMILSSSGTVMVDPYAKGDTDTYISYLKQDAGSDESFVCRFGNDDGEDLFKSNYDIFSAISSPTVVSGTNLRTYRLALAVTGEYTAKVGGGTIAGALAAQVLIMNRVNGIYERDLAIRMILVGNNDSIIYTDGATDPYTNDDGATMLGQNQTNLNSVIGSANYDIGHVFSTDGGGIASIRAVCSNNNKARGETGLANPIGDAFAIDYVAHEMGHQFGANHTFNATSSNRASTAAYEPGSGVTVMGYAGVISGQNLAAHSIDTFHVRSLEEIIAFKENGSTGGSCGAGTATGNTAPMVTAPALFTIPKLTPFALTASAVDPDGDSVTYDWQEYDRSSATSAVPNTDTDGVARPIFRPYLPTTSGTRVFPSLSYILNNGNVPPGLTGGFLTGEILPSISRTMSFQVIARDNRATGGGIGTATTSIAVDGNSGPFVVTAPDSNVSWTGNSVQTVTWNVANTSNSPVNAVNVNILLSTDGGNTFPIVISSSTPNDGSETITVPNVNTTQARIKIEAAGNVFFDISNANFSISAPASANALVAGRVQTSIGRGISGAFITMTDSRGNVRTAITNPFGYYNFQGVPAGENYTVTARAKRYTFSVSSQMLYVSGDVANINFVGILRLL